MPDNDPPDPGADPPPEESVPDPPIPDLPDTEQPDPENPEAPTPSARRPRKPRKPRAPKVPLLDLSPEPPKSLDDIIREALASPKSATVDGQNVTAHDLRQLIDADRYLAAKKAAGKPAIRFTKLVPPGAE